MTELCYKLSQRVFSDNLKADDVCKCKNSFIFMVLKKKQLKGNNYQLIFTNNGSIHHLLHLVYLFFLFVSLCNEYFKSMDILGVDDLFRSIFKCNFMRHHRLFKKTDRIRLTYVSNFDHQDPFVDIGCGEVSLHDCLGKNHQFYYGIDIDPEQCSLI